MIPFFGEVPAFMLVEFIDPDYQRGRLVVRVELPDGHASILPDCRRRYQFTEGRFNPITDEAVQLPDFINEQLVDAFAMAISEHFHNLN